VCRDIADCSELGPTSTAAKTQRYSELRNTSKVQSESPTQASKGGCMAFEVSSPAIYSSRKSMVVTASDIQPLSDSFLPHLSKHAVSSQRVYWATSDVILTYSNTTASSASHLHDHFNCPNIINVAGCTCLQSQQQLVLQSQHVTAAKQSFTSLDKAKS